MRPSSKLRVLTLSLVVTVAWALPLQAQNAESAADARPDDGSVLPFPVPPMGGSVGVTIKDSVHKWRKEERRLPEDAPNILIVMLDDSGNGQADAFGGEIAMPTLSRLAKEGISYTAFHTTAMCSPTRASLLTGRNHHRVGNGQIAEFANDWDGYTGVIPKTSATFPEVLGYYGYATAAFGKWHNTPIDTLGSGPYDRFPTGHGFDYFYGFIAGETSQWEPVLWENTTPIATPHPKNYKDYHLTEDMADKAISWMQRHRALHPNRPFLVYWTPGAVHGPHHVAKKWADKYKGRFSDGWDVLKQRVFERQKKLGLIPADATLSPRPESLAAWDSIPAGERAYQERLMEVYAGFLEHTDIQVGKLVDAVEDMGIRDNTLIIYIQSDNGPSAEGVEGSIAELNAQNAIPTKVSEHIAVLDELGGLDMLGTPRVDNMYHAGWAWAGSSPYRYVKLVAGDFGGTRTPMVISWPDRIARDSTMRKQFLHVNDIAPTLYDILGITPPKEVAGFAQDPIDGVSFADTFADPAAPSHKKTQYFEILGSRGVYNDGWYAFAFGIREPWNPTGADVANWDPLKDKWELFDLGKDVNLSHDLSAEHPEKLAEMKEIWLAEAKENKVLPIGGGLLGTIDTSALKRTTNTEWVMSEGMTRIPEAEAPNLRNGNIRVDIEATVPERASGVIFALGGYAGGVSLFVVDGRLHYEYSSLLLKRTKIDLGELPVGDVEIAMEMRTPPGWGGLPGELVFWINGEKIKEATVDRTIPGAFTASETFDVGMDTASPVADAYFDKVPFAFTGTLKRVVFKNL
ncbi:MAG: arylsulfatase [Hyphomicrobiales bacterium]|nr:arylsulfatase [Hyphomicrobiales bacterium]